MHLMKIPLVEDDKLLNHHLSTLLDRGPESGSQHGQRQVALHYATDYPIDVAIIDLGLPDMDGLQLISACASSRSLPHHSVDRRGPGGIRWKGWRPVPMTIWSSPFQKDELLPRLNVPVRRSAGFISPG